MIDRSTNDQSDENSGKFREMEIENKIGSYQIEELHKELDYLKRRLALVPEPVQWCCKHIQQFWWTVSSLAGLGWLHNGARPMAQNTSSEPTIQIPTIQPAEMPVPRLFLDVTVTCKSKLNTGVQRVIRELCRYGESGGELAPVLIENGHFVTLPNLIPLRFQQGDKILLLDSGWTHTEMYPPALARARQEGADIILGIYDLIPVQYPGFVHPYFTSIFENWLKTVTPFCKTALTISRYSADSFKNWTKKQGLYSSIQEIGWFHLGANFPALDNVQQSNFRKRKTIPDSFVLSVGTIEPRKGYSCALDAFDILWSEGSSLCYVIIGRKGDLASHVIDRIINHPQFEKKLFWPQDVGDQDLANYYKLSTCVLIPALAEGFGLPLIEANFYGKPVIASNLQVFVEVAPKGVKFFEATRSDKLVEAIKELSLQTDLPAQGLPTLDWQLATNNMIEIVKSSKYQIKY
jgi:glycosyltransferase involved in cell wall biosynthesis